MSPAAGSGRAKPETASPGEGGFAGGGRWWAALAAKSPVVLRGAAGVVAAVALMELVVRVALPSGVVFPPPSQVLWQAAGLPADPDFLAGAIATARTWAAGLAAAVAVGVPAGVLLGALPPVERATRPLLEFLRPIPSVAIIPLAILLIPADFLMKAAVVTYAAVWPVLINTLYGMREVDPMAKDSLRAFGFGELSVLARVSLPSAAPFVLTGARLAAGVALILAVSAELVAGGTAGVGVYVIAAGSADRTDLVLAAAFWTGVFGLLADGAFAVAGRRAFRWRRTCG